MAEIIDVGEATRLTGYTRDWIKKLAQRGKIQAFKLHQRAWAIDRDSLLSYHHAQQQKQKGATDG